MSNSRLEKFIYAICGMDVDDLPTPLSRIETLWNCLITGEMPDFEPLSRNEKYLMAMLNGDIDGLPEPTSRSEKLLYKITTGETDLTDVPGYLSRYEELLKYLIENGGIGGTDFEYVLYTLKQPLSTLYSTAEAPVKSAILKGNTLVNLQSMTSIAYQGSNDGIIVKENNRIICTSKSTTGTNIRFKYVADASKTYTIKCRVINNSSSDIKFLDHPVSIGNPLVTVSSGEMITINFKFKPHSASTNMGIFLFINHAQGRVVDEEVVIEDLVILEGDYTNQDIPYFEGMQSVKMPVLTTTGRNLIGSEIIAGWLNTSNGEINNLTSTTTCATKDLIKVKPATHYSIYKEYDKRVLYAQFNEKQEFINFGTYTHNGFTTDSNAMYVRWFFETPINEELKVMLYEGGYNSNISYEPYRSNILTVNENVVLRGISDVQDTLDLLTGEVVGRIGEVVFDGSEDEIWSIPTNFSNGECKGYSLNVDNLTSILICDSLNILPNSQKYGTNEGVFASNGSIIIKKNLATRELLKEWLSQNPITVQYQLATESVKTVVLSTLDQDGQPTKLSTFNDITHVSIEAGDLLPTIDLEVATKIEETLSTLPTLMNDISETQQLLNESIDDQAENINEVSTAITEIHSDIL